VLTLLAALALQDPDLSTPERALDAYLKARDKFSASTSIVADTERVVAEVEGPAVSDDLKTRREKRRNERVALEHLQRQPYVAHLVEEAREEGGRIVLTAREFFVVRYLNRATGRMGEEQKERWRQFVFEKVGTRWLIQKEFDRCGPCGGKGRCPWCEGEGTVADKPCPRCKSTKKCDTCVGARWKERSFERGLTALPSLEGFKARADRSGPRAAAEAFADVLVEEQLRIAAVMGRMFDDVIRLMRTYFTPDVSRAAELALKKSAEEGAASLKEHKPEVLELKEEEETRASAVVSMPPSPFGPASRCRLVLLRFGSSWLVDDVQPPCASCGAKGACAGCVATKDQSIRCIRCGGSKKCRDCSGVGYRSEGK